MRNIRSKLVTGAAVGAAAVGGAAIANAASSSSTTVGGGGEFNRPGPTGVLRPGARDRRP